jgi:hypothetical protein
MTQAIPGYGTLLKVGDGATPESFTTILHVKALKPLGFKAQMEDATAHDSPDGWTETKPTLIDGGTVKFSVFYVPTAATHNATTGLKADAINRTLRNFQLVYPDASTEQFAAYVSNFGPDAPVKGFLSAEFELSITGKPVTIV